MVSRYNITKRSNPIPNGKMRRGRKNSIQTSLIFLLLFIVYSEGRCADEVKDLAPVEPTTASLGKYGEYPVNYSNGLPNIEIPIYDVRSGDLSLNLSLKYHGGGLKVNEDATWVGLGWDLFYGGMITRQVNGFPDEDEDLTRVPDEEELRDALQQMDIFAFNRNNDIRNLANPESGANSFMPDVYHYMLGDYSGKFVLNNEGQAMTVPYVPIQVSNEATLKKIVLPDGTIYQFAKTDKTDTPGTNKKYSAIYFSLAP